MGPDDLEAEEFGAEDPTPSPVTPQSVTVQNTGRKVHTVWPYGDFHVEDVPTVTNDGVELNDADLKTVREAAEANGVKIRVEGGN